MADIRKLTDRLSVAPQLTTDDIGQVVSLSFQSVLCNRPDTEEAGQPDYEQIRLEAEDHGLVSEFQPVVGSAISDQDIDRFAAHLESLPQPVLAYCRSGTRCTALWALSEAGKQPTDSIISAAAAAGYSMEPLRARIDERASRINRQ